MINVFQPALQAEELEAVRVVFESNWIGKGRETQAFETEFAQHLNVEASRVRSASCCTEALFQAMSLLEIGPGDEVILPSCSFVGAGNAVASCGAIPVWCDVDRRTLNPRASHIEACLSPRTKAVLITHYGGAPCEMDALAALTQEHHVTLIEDSACSVASSFRGQACGTWGAIGTWSFDAMKILVTGDGAMMCCNTPELAARAEERLYLGLSSQSGLAGGGDGKWWEFEVSGFERRAVMNDISSAIGREQLKKLPSFIAQRRKITDFYDDALGDLEWLQTPPELPSHACSSHYFYHVQTAPDVRDRLAFHLRDHGIYSTFRYYPLHWVERFTAVAKLSPLGLKETEIAARTTLNIPIHQSLSPSDLDHIASTIRAFGTRI